MCCGCEVWFMDTYNKANCCVGNDEYHCNSIALVVRMANPSGWGRLWIYSLNPRMMRFQNLVEAIRSNDVPIDNLAKHMPQRNTSWEM